MLRTIFMALSKSEKHQFCEKLSASEDTVRVKYMSPKASLRKKPSQYRFDAMLVAANEIRPNSINREELAAYFYAAPDKTGQEKAEAA